jgi:putative ABC transport system substrate-binding protein
VIGYLGTQSADNDYKNFTVPFLQGLKETGYVEGQNVAIEYRWAENQVDRLPELAADLVRRRVAVIVAGSNPPALAAKASTTTIPIVFVAAGDPVAVGLVASLNRPGANVTGSASLEAELGPNMCAGPQRRDRKRLCSQFRDRWGRSPRKDRSDTNSRRGL